MFQKIPEDPVRFWTAVKKYRHGGPVTVAVEDDQDEPPFSKIAIFALSRLTVAHSTAVVERVFSLVSHVKTNTRNGLSTVTFESILHLKSHLYSRDSCCMKLEVTDRMLKLFNHLLYDYKAKQQGDDNQNQRLQEDEAVDEVLALTA